MRLLIHDASVLVDLAECGLLFRCQIARCYFMHRIAGELF